MHTNRHGQKHYHTFAFDDGQYYITRKTAEIAETDHEKRPSQRADTSEGHLFWEMGLAYGMLAICPETVTKSWESREIAKENK